MTGGKLATCAAHSVSLDCLNPWSNVWNMLFNSGEGWFHRTMALQNQRRLCVNVNFEIYNEKSHLSSDLGHASRVCLHQRAEPSISRILLFVVSNFVKGLAPGLRKLWQMWCNHSRMHKAYASDRNSCILMETPWCLGM
jgi:hypothetical protein